VDERLMCVRLFGEVKLPETVPLLLQLAASALSNELRKAALTSLLLYDDENIGREVTRLYANLPADIQPAAQTLLTSRPAWSLAFLQLLETGSVNASTIPPAVAANLREHSDKVVAALAQKLFAKAAAKPEIRAEIERVRRVLASAAGDPYKGELVFMQRCATCHTLFFKGGHIGPDLTAYQRDDLGTLLPSILDPSAEIREGFVNQIVSTNDGRTLSGFLADQDPSVIVLRGLDGQNVSLARSDVREMRASPMSLMPDGLLNGLDDQALRDFFAYLRIPQPITP
jgi:putative heme-binding domain-containing protein